MGLQEGEKGARRGRFPSALRPSERCRGPDIGFTKFMTLTLRAKLFVEVEQVVSGRR
jgi:hypothetical protein